jgi:hypothetical protein
MRKPNPYTVELVTADHGGWIENEDGTWSYLIRRHGNKYFRSHKTVSKQEAFKYILMGDEKGTDNGEQESS